MTNREDPGPARQSCNILEPVSFAPPDGDQAQYFGAPQLRPLQPRSDQMPMSPGVSAQSSEHERLLYILDNMRTFGFSSLLDFILCLFESEDSAVKRRVSIFYSHGGPGKLMETMLGNKRAREHGGDEAAVHWATVALKEEFESGLVKGSVCFPSVLATAVKLTVSRSM
jgi:hypothetical protein